MHDLILHERIVFFVDFYVFIAFSLFIFAPGSLGEQVAKVVKGYKRAMKGQDDAV